VTTPDLDRLQLIDEFSAALAPVGFEAAIAGSQHLAAMAREYVDVVEPKLIVSGAARSGIAAFGSPGVPTNRTAYRRVVALHLAMVPVAQELLAARGWQLALAAVETHDTEAVAWLLTASEAPDGIDTAAWTAEQTETAR
jgi:hypothetical protein